MEALGRVERPTNGLGSVKLSLILKNFNKIALQNANKYGRIRKLYANKVLIREAMNDCLPSCILPPKRENAPGLVIPGRLVGMFFS